MNEQADHPDIEKLPLEIDGIPVRETIREIFRNPENGTPDKISRAGCLVLALRSNDLGRAAGEGKTHVLWNAWRTVFPAIGTNANRIDFSGFCFRKDPLEPGLSFAGMEFGDFANFQATQFEYYVIFKAAQFGDLSTFKAAQFKQGARFTAAQFGNYADFCGARFGWNAIFTAVQFGPNANFLAAHFMNSANFRAMNWARMSKFYGQRFDAAKEWSSRRGLSPETFQSIDFSGATFEETVSFSNRQFEDETTFGLLPAVFKRQTVKRDKDGNGERNDIGILIFEDAQDQRRHTVFQRAPIFHGCKLHQDSSFEGAQFPPDIGKASGSEKAARAYRTLKLAFSEQHAVREEQRFFKLEMEEEALREKSFRKFLFQAYKTFSDYGFSVTRPLLYLALFPLGWMFMLYACLSLLEIVPIGTFAHELPVNSWLAQVLRWSLAGALPIPGIDLAGELRVQLFGSGGIATMAWVVEVVQKILSLAGLFLTGLALRNLFKLK